MVRHTIYMLLPSTMPRLEHVMNESSPTHEYNGSHRSIIRHDTLVNVSYTTRGHVSLTYCNAW